MKSSMRGAARLLAVGLLCTVVAACGDDKRSGGGAAGEGGSGGTGGAGASGGTGGAGGSGGEQAVRFEDPTGASGTRLSRRYLEAGPGAYMTADFWDTELETACSFGTATDGALRCLPDSYSDIYFSDAGCTEPIIVVRDEDTFDCRSAWARSRIDGSYYRRTETPAVLTGGLTYYRTETGCSALGLGAAAENWVAEKIVSASFVRGTRDDEARADGLVSRFVDGEDGSRVLLETVHGARGYACSFDSEGHCLPPTAPAWAFADAACTQPVAAYYAAAGEAPALVAIPERDGRGCQNGARIYERGAAVTTQLYYRNTVGACATYGSSSIYRYFRAGAEVSPDELPRASVVHEGSGSLVARRYVDENGEAIGSVHQFWDTTRDEACHPATLGGGFTCVPVNRAFISGYEFSDALCTESSEIALAQCAAEAPRLLFDARSRSCATARVEWEVVAAYERGAEVDAYFFRNDFVSCEAREMSPWVDAYAVGPEATGSLPLLTFGTEE